MRHLRTVFDLEDKSVIESLCARAQKLKRDRAERRLQPTLSGRVLAMLFEKHSTRTRVSFEAGVSLLGGSAVVMQARDTQLQQGEVLRDAARVVGGYVDVLMVRTFGQDIVEAYARHAGVPVVNGLSDLDHPCQVLTDLFTVYERHEDPFSLTWAWVGDGGHMLNGTIAAAALAGFELRVALPAGRAPDDAVLARARSMGARVEITDDPRAAVEGANVVSTDSWKAREDGTRGFTVDHALLAGAADDHLLLHPLPAQRGEEVTDDALEGRHSVVFQQAGNRLPVQQAILEHLIEAPVF
jgi:ornithine carbamoyltransferase